MFKQTKEKVLNAVKWVNNKVDIGYKYVYDKSVPIAKFLKKYFKFVKYVVGGGILGIYYGVKDGYTIWKYGDDIVTHIDGLSDDLKDLDIDNLEPIDSEDADAVEAEKPV